MANKKIIDKIVAEFMQTDGSDLEGDLGEILEKYLSKDIDENISDGYHSFKELYDHRIALFIAFMKSNPKKSWRANNHHDGSNYPGRFIAGMHLDSGDISYHLPSHMRTKLDGLGIDTMARAPLWDGHTSQNVVDRLLIENFNKDG